MISKSDNPRTRLLAYLMGALSLDDRNEIERKMLSDQEFSDEMKEAEYDLIEDYHHGRLTPEEHSRTETAFGRRRLAECAPVHRRSPAAGLQGDGIRRAKRLSLIAAAMLVVVISGWFAVSHLWRKPEPSQGPVQASLKLPESKSSSPGAEPTASRRDQTAVLLLLSGASRGVAENTLQLHQATKNILVQWVVPNGLKESRFVLVLKQGRRTLATAQQTGPLKRTDGSSIAEFQLPAAKLQTESQFQALLLIRSAHANDRVLEELPIRVMRESKD